MPGGKELQDQKDQKGESINQSMEWKELQDQKGESIKGSVEWKVQIWCCWKGRGTAWIPSHSHTGTMWGAGNGGRVLSSEILLDVGGFVEPDSFPWPVQAPGVSWWLERSWLSSEFPGEQDCSLGNISIPPNLSAGV